MRTIKPHILVLTNAFPVKDDPNKGLDVQEQLRRLSAFYEIKVIYARPSREVNRLRMPFFSKLSINNLDVFETNYYTFPKIGILTSGISYYFSCSKLIYDIHRTFTIDLIISYWTYPEGFAASLISRKLNIPLIIRPRGSDINFFMRYALLRSLIRYALKRTTRIIPVCYDLKKTIKELGISDDKIHCIPFGVDSTKFRPLDKEACRKKLGINLDCKMVLFIGNLVEVKGIDYLLKAMMRFENFSENNGTNNIVLYILGTGRLESKYREIINEFKKCKVILQGEIPNDEIPFWMNSSDLFCLPSISEGYPNVLMEALACGVPIVASKVGGIPEIIDSPDLGILVFPKKADELYEAIQVALEKKWNKTLLINRALKNDWEKVTERIITEFETLMR
jgi:teichuronic acid biosynthesis glycosyltransferase TuaC